MEFTVNFEGEADEKRRWVVCPGRSAARVHVKWEPTKPFLAKDGDKAGGPAAPVCRISYLTAPGAHPGHLPETLPLENLGISYENRLELVSPPFYPLRVRIELQPAAGRAHVRVLHIVPLASVWAATGLVVVSLGLAAVILTMTLATLRITLTQAATGFSGMALVVLASIVVRHTLSHLRPGDLPYLGVTFLVQRSVLACALGFLALSAVLRGCVVEIHNDTRDELRFALPWRDSPDPIGPDARISVVPPDGRALRDNVLAFLAKDQADRPLCIIDSDGHVPRAYACRPPEEPPPPPGVAQQVRGWFTPQTITVRCGRRWPDLKPEQVLPKDLTDARVESDSVWFEPRPESGCGRSQQANLWYRHDGAVHRVRYPWRPGDLAAQARLSLEFVAGEHTPAQVTLVSVDAAPQAPVRETRIVLPHTNAALEQVWPLAGVAEESTAMTLQIGDLLATPTDSFAFGAELKCTRGQGPSTHFHATQLGLIGRAGWLTKLTTRRTQGLSWTSEWTLARAGGVPLAAPWICETLPGDAARLSDRAAFATDSLTVVTDERADWRGAQAVILPAHLMARDIEIYRKTTGSGTRVGRLECLLETDAAASIAVGRVALDDQRGGKIDRFAVDTKRDKNAARWEPDAAAAAGETADRSEAWLCWRFEPDHDGTLDVTVTPLAGDLKNKPLTAEWKIDDGELSLHREGARICYVHHLTFDIASKLPAGATELQAPDLAEIKAQRPHLRGCQRVVPFTPKGGT